MTQQHPFQWHVIDYSNEEEEVYQIFSRLRSMPQKLYWNKEGKQKAIAERDRLNALEQWDINYPPEKVAELLAANAVPYPSDKVFKRLNMKVVND